MRSARQSATLESESWCRYFSTIAVAEDHLPWGHPTRLSGEEKHCIGKSIQQFQLGVEHGQVFRTAGYSRRGFLTEAFWEFNWLDRAVCRRLLSAHIGGLQR